MGFFLLAAVLLTALYIVNMYNALVTKKSRIENGFAQIQVQLKRRYDLIPALVKTVKSYMKYEKETLEAVIEARNQANGALTHVHDTLQNSKEIKELGEKEQLFVHRLDSVQMLMEGYPDLKANETVLRLMEELGSAENRIAFARQAYNDFVYSFNTYRQSFPQNVIAGHFGFDHDASLLEFDDVKEMQRIPDTAL